MVGVIVHPRQAILITTSLTHQPLPGQQTFQVLTSCTMSISRTIFRRFDFDTCFESRCDHVQVRVSHTDFDLSGAWESVA